MQSGEWGPDKRIVLNWISRFFWVMVSTAARRGGDPGVNPCLGNNLFLRF